MIGVDVRKAFDSVVKNLTQNVKTGFNYKAKTLRLTF